MSHPARKPTGARIEIDRDGEDGALRLRLEGRLEGVRIGALWRSAERALQSLRPDHVVLDASCVTYCDAAGAAFVVHLEELQEQHGGELRVEAFPEAYQPVLDLVLRARPASRVVPPRSGWVESIGEYTVSVVRDTARLIAYIGELVLALAYTAAHPLRMRWSDAFRAAQTAGVNSLPVVFLVSFLLGLVMGFQAANQLHRFGADIFLADLIGLSMVRELGPLMTAIVLTARSGSAFAAEMGTMRINEEIDALETMGVDPVRFLVGPRVMAAVVMTPILTVFANIAGVAGGAVVWVFTLDLALPGYMAELQIAVDLLDVTSGLIKSLVFGLLVAAVGCIRGMQTRGGPAGVGRQTTSAVVSGIVLIAITDTLFTFLFHELGI